jgi:matrixin
MAGTRNSTYTSPASSSRSHRTVKAAPSLLAAALLLAAPARSYVLWGTSLGPRNHPFYIDPTFPLSCNGTVQDQVGAILLAAQEWGKDGGADFRYMFMGLATYPYPPGASVLVMGTSCVGYPMASGYFTTCMFGNLPFDVSGSPPPSTFDLQGSSVHQMGHALGLGHTNVPGCSMFTQSIDALDFRTIEPDDVAGIQAIYGPVPAGTPVLDYLGLPFTGETIELRLGNTVGPALVLLDLVPGPTVVPGIGTLEVGGSPGLIYLPFYAPMSMPIPLPSNPVLIGTNWYMHALVLNGTSVVLSNPFHLAVPY